MDDTAPETPAAAPAPEAMPASTRLLLPVLQMMAAKAVHTAAELGLADLLAERPYSSAELAEKTGAHHGSLRRLLLALAGLGVVTQGDDDRFSLAALGQPLRRDAPDSVLGLVRLGCGPEVWRAWEHLLPSVRTGQPAWELAHGVDWLGFYADNPERAAVFHRSQAEHTRDTMPGILAAADFSRFPTVVDVGGGDGTLMAHVLSSHPGLEGVLVDLPSGLAGAAGRLAAAGVTDRCRVVGGDFFTSVPEGGDAYVLKEILHDWEDDRAVAILRTVRAAMPPDGRLVVVERVLPERAAAGPVEAHLYLRDLLMLTVTGGRERTEQEFHALFGAAGFAPARTSHPLPSGYRVVEAVPA
ncbi:methyltransferase [Streptomyces sp. WAC05374]|uniref:methyltransferase n=1 Tax=Streptomyces sp. WAC05374 TaxID=2487420 RepID=UPI000F88AA65|nr:methyltransferase [Streptomyces sp. WAC05374]RST18638.1 methyltransferase [Streptomyces sp. WAC05374]TDF40707.1 methyltransferase [Streptomyces sp. WAC05374]TDF49385.1 methyltransferase [Streptomyces sp. WAC05374]TDF49922.1 methyltransferase [Streptomyces sp. WAC05374]